MAEATLDNKDYLLTIRVPIKAIDDVQARKVANEVLKYTGSQLLVNDGLVKLQEIKNKDKPRHVNF